VSGPALLVIGLGALGGGIVLLLIGSFSVKRAPRGVAGSIAAIERHYAQHAASPARTAVARWRGGQPAAPAGRGW
jgi:hypothetical protein